MCCVAARRHIYIGIYIGACAKPLLEHKLFTLVGIYSFAQIFHARVNQEFNLNTFLAN